MDPQRWRQIEDLYHAALGLPSDQRIAFLERSCLTDPSLGEEVESLLQASSEASSLLDRPLLELEEASESDDSVPLPAGSEIGPYIIEAPLGTGGMGEVYRAKDRRLGRSVALKMLPAHLANSENLRRRLKREARLISTLNHQNICTIHDVGEFEGRPFLVMELLQGEPLHQRLSKGRLADSELLEIALQIVDGLAVAHQQGIVHRDIKPGNIFISTTVPGGQSQVVKILDFGLAKAQFAGTTTLSGGPLTSPGMAVGTVSYMSPEQASGEEIDVRSDLFSLGVVLYEMATGERPFEGDSPAATMLAIQSSDAIPADQKNPELSPKLAAVIARLLQKRREARFQSAAELRSALNQIRDSKPVSRPSKPLQRMAFALLVLLALVAVWLVWIRFHRAD